jgi:hypothetical protein
MKAHRRTPVWNGLRDCVKRPEKLIYIIDVKPLLEAL